MDSNSTGINVNTSPSGGAGPIHFKNGEKVTTKQEVKYLGCLLNNKGDPAREVAARIFINNYTCFGNTETCRSKTKF